MKRIAAFFRDQLMSLHTHHNIGRFDADNNIIAFSGSTNESETAFVDNYEVMDVYCSWQSSFEEKKVAQKELADALTSSVYYSQKYISDHRANIKTLTREIAELVKKIASASN